MMSQSASDNRERTWIYQWQFFQCTLDIDMIMTCASNTKRSSVKSHAKKENRLFTGLLESAGALVEFMCSTTSLRSSAIFFSWLSMFSARLYLKSEMKLSCKIGHYNCVPTICPLCRLVDCINVPQFQWVGFVLCIFTTDLKTLPFTIYSGI